MMTSTLLAGVLAQGGAPQQQLQDSVSTGESVLFFILAPLMVVAGMGLWFAKKAVHAALCTAFIMVSLAVMYAAQGAQFLFAAQIVVYTGAVMMLFLFVLMLVGVDTQESLKETISGHRIITIVAGAGLGLMAVGLITGLFGGFLTFETIPKIRYVGLDAANADGNATGVARIIFGEFVIALELVGTLLISAAVGAIVLTHKERLKAPLTQKDLQALRVKSGRFVAGLPGPGVFAQHNSVDTPALLPDGSVSSASVSRVLRARGQNSPADHLGDDVAHKLEDLHVANGDQRADDADDTSAVEAGK